MNQQKWREKAYDEWVGRTTGSRLNMDQARGADARRAADAAARASWQNTPKPTNFARPVATSGPVYRGAPSPAAMGSAAGPWQTQRVRSSGHAGVSRVLALVGALVGYAYGAATDGQAPWLYAVAGVCIGAFALDVLTFVFKVVRFVVLAILALLGLAVALYVLANLFGK